MGLALLEEHLVFCGTTSTGYNAFLFIVLLDSKWHRRWMKLTVVVFGETGSKALSLFASCDLLAVYICVAFQTVHQILTVVDHKHHEKNT